MLLLGNILNIYDSLNFDIGFKEEIGDIDVQPEMYEYTDINSTSELIEKQDDMEVVNGKSYRCHLRDLRGFDAS